MPVQRYRLRPEKEALSYVKNTYCAANCIIFYTCTDQDRCLSTKKLYNERLELEKNNPLPLWYSEYKEGVII